MLIVFLHVTAVFIAFALTTGVGIFVAQIVRAGDVAAIRVAAQTAVPLATAGGIVLILGALTGLYAATQVGYPLTSRWLSVTYICVAAIVLDGFLNRLPWLRALAKSAQDSSEDKPSEELRALSASRLAAISGPVSGLLWLTILVMMTMKP